MKNLTRALFVLVGSLPVVVMAGGGGTPYDAIADAADFSEALTAVGAVAAAVAVVYVTIRGFKIAMSFLRS